MSKKRSQPSDDLPSFADLDRMYEELLRLRAEVEAEEDRAHAPSASKVRINNQIGLPSDRKPGQK
jgi:hypothetical protein